MRENRKNNLYTSSYFIKRLKDSGFIVVKIWYGFADSDPRKWTILVDPGDASIFVTCFQNKEDKGDIMFEMNDGGRRYPKNFSIKTDSMEVIISSLVEKGVSTNAEASPFHKERDGQD